MLASVIALGAFLRLYGLGDSPAWYGDEFVHLELAQNLRSFEARVGAFRVDWFGTIAHPPLFFLLGSLFLATFGESIASLRLVPALGGCAAIGLLYVAGVLLRGRCFGLLAASAYAVLPLAVVLDRRAYAYPLVFPLALGVLILLLRYRVSADRRCLYAASGLMSLLLITGHYTVPLLGVFGLFVLIHQPRLALQCLGISLLGPLITSSVFLLPRWEPATFTIAWELERAAFQSLDLLELVHRNLEFVSCDLVVLTGALGLLFMRGPALGWFGLVLLAVSQFLLYRRPDLEMMYYPTGAFLGFFALPFAAFFLGLRDLGLRGVARLAPGRGQTTARSAVLICALGAPALLLGVKLLEIAPDVWRGRIETPLDVLAERSSDVRAARGYLAGVLGPDDLVAASPTLTHALPGRRTDLMQVYVYETGKGTPFYPAYGQGLPGYREQVFAFDCSLEEVDYLVLSRVDWRWSLHRDFARRVLGAGAAELAAESREQPPDGHGALTIRGQPWPLLHRSGEVFVLKNPNTAPSIHRAALRVSPR